MSSEGRVSTSHKRFQKENRDLLQFLHLILVATRPDVREILKTGSTDERMDRHLKALDDWMRGSGDVAVPQLWKEILITRSVDYFLIYLSDAIHAVVKTRPEILRSSDRVEVALVLRFESIGEFVDYWAFQKVDQLSHGGFEEMRRYLETSLGIKPAFSPSGLKEVKEAIAIRNVIVHRRGIVNEHFLRDTGWSGIKIGDPLSIPARDLLKYNKALRSLGKTIDASLVAKFGHW